MNTKQFLSDILDEFNKIDYVKPEDIPNIDLYMDQVTTFMDSQLATSKRHEDDKILTKTMINNYAKNDLLPPPVKKKYSREHMLLLIFIYYFKSILSIKDIETVLKPLTEKYFSGNDTMELSSIYEELCHMEKERLDSLKDSVSSAYDKAGEAFDQLPDGEDRDILQKFAFICNLSFDVYLKKMMIERIIDDIAAPSSKNKKD